MEKYENRRRGTRVLLVVGRRHLLATRDLDSGVLICRDLVDATGELFIITSHFDKMSKVASFHLQQEHPSRLECSGESILQVV